TVVGASLVGDDQHDLARAMSDAAEAADLIIVSGGLGPTVDDCTRAAAARAAGVALVRRQDLVDDLVARYARRAIPMPSSNLLQAEVPDGADVLPNRHGTAPGFRMSLRGAKLYALPGPPHEMRGVFVEEAL